MTPPRALPGLVALLLLATIPHPAASAPVPRQAPGLSFITPPGGVVLDCPGVQRTVPWLVSLGTALDARGFDVVEPVATGDAARGIAAIVRCVAPGTTTAPAQARPAPVADTPPTAAAAPASTPTQAATQAPAATTAAEPPTDAAAQPAGPPVVEIPSPLPESRAQAVADRVAALVAGSTAFPRPARVLFLVEDTTDTGRALLVQTSWVTAYARLPAEFVDVSRLAGLPLRWLDRYDAVVLATDRLPRGAVDRLARAFAQYVEQGGSLVAAAGVEDEELFPLFGIRQSSGEAAIRTYGCDDSFWPGAKGLDPVLDADGLDRVPRYRLAKDVRVLCHGGQPGALDVPMAFTVRRGKGATLAWAGARLADKSSRGQILLSILEVSPLPAAILDALVFYADDCPLPMTNTKRPPADRLYDLTDSDFYRTMWWPRMRDLFQKYAIRPTTGFILTYDDRMPGDAPPTGYLGPEGAPALELAHAIRDAGYEIGLHGYNHQSLSVGKNEWTVGWAGRAAMDEALHLLRGEFQRIFGPGAEPAVYVAPSNFIQKMGKEALRAAFPEIAGIASQYLDEGPILGQEFAPDPDVPALVALPRISSEHFLDGGNSQEMLDALVLPGVFSHFVHPDDFFDPERSRGEDFDGMMRRLDDLLSRVTATYPFLRRMTGSELARHVPAWRRARLEVLREASGLLLRVVDPPAGGLTVLVRAPRGTTVTFQGTCTEAFRAPTESRYYYRVGSEACAIAWH